LGLDERDEPRATLRELGFARQPGADDERRAVAGELLGRLAADVLARHPAELLEIEDRARLLNVLDVEVLDQLIDAEELGRAIQRPALEAQEVDHRGAR